MPSAMSNALCSMASSIMCDCSSNIP
jgi:hypothetical protein